jgi:hypothetical protein
MMLLSFIIGDFLFRCPHSVRRAVPVPVAWSGCLCPSLARPASGSWRLDLSGRSVVELGLPHLFHPRREKSTTFVSTLPTVLMWCMGLGMWRFRLVDWWLVSALVPLGAVLVVRLVWGLPGWWWVLLVIGVVAPPVSAVFDWLGRRGS